MSIREFVLPDLGEGLEDATITEWAVAVGDVVELNQPLCTVETNKAQVEIPSPYAGRIVELGGTAGETLAVGAALVRIDVAADRDPVLVGYGADGAMDRSRRRPSLSQSPQPQPSPSPQPARARAKPPVRKLAADLDVDLAAIGPGSGPDGIITRDDVLAAAETGELLEVRGVHAAMAERMTLSRRQIPDAHARVEVDCTALLQLRTELDEPDVTPFTLTLRLLLLTLRRHPVLNASWVDDRDGPRIRRHAAVQLGIAAATPRGLLVPVITDADQKTLRELSGAVARLVASARAGTLKPAELGGSTFTVSNYGALGLDDAVPVINYPEAAIIGVGAIKPRPVVVDDAVVARPIMGVTCVFDHRIADGAQVAAFLVELRELIECPGRALLDLR